MPRYLSCRSCSGKGQLPCKTCVCPECKGRKQVPCRQCYGGRVRCPACNGGGRREFFLFKRAILLWVSPCTGCHGQKTFSCGSCIGKGVTTCPVCAGEGRIRPCSQCNTTLFYACADCNGAGQVEDEAFNVLSGLSTDKLQLEYRQAVREVAQLEREIDDLNHEYDRVYAWYKEDFDRNREAYNAPGCEPAALNQIPDRIRDIRRTMSQIAERMSDIDDIITARTR